MMAIMGATGVSGDSVGEGTGVTGILGWLLESWDTPSWVNTGVTGSNKGLLRQLGAPVE